MNTILLNDINKNTLRYTGMVSVDDYFYSALHFDGKDYPFGTARRKKSYFVTAEINGAIVWYCDTCIDIRLYVSDKIECQFKHFFYILDDAIECAHNLKRTDQVLDFDKVERAKINT